jgi:hypothetical protein
MSPAKPTPVTRKSAPPKARTLVQGATTVSGEFGLMIEVNNTPLIITASDLKNLKADGLTFNYDRDPPQEIGTLDTLLAWLSSELKVTISLSDLESAPFVGPFISAIAKAHVSVGQFDLRIQGTDTTKPPSSFTLAGSVQLDKPPSFGPLTIEGFTFGASAQVGS